MLKKRKLAQGKVRVTFAMPALEGVNQLYLVGEFNEWSHTATPMKKAKDGSWSTTLTLESNREYHYRYVDDKDVWHNDWAPDSYARNMHGTDNSVVNLVNGDRPKTRVKKKSL